MLGSKQSYNASISASYSFSDACLITVLFGVRINGFSLEVIKIISLKIRLNVGAILFASSIIGLGRR